MYKQSSISRTTNSGLRTGLLAAVAAAMVAFAPSTVRAADTQITTTSTTISTTNEGTAWIPTVTPATTGPNGQLIDYSALINSPFDYAELHRARVEGFSNREVATIAKISILTGVDFSDIESQALAGISFPTMADRYNLRLKDVWQVGDYEDKIAAYKLAYENSGANEVRNMVAASQQEMISGPALTAMSNSNEDLAAEINSSPDLTMFARAVRSARLMGVLRGEGPYTVFAPTDAAFAKLSTDQANALMSNRSMLATVIKYHIIPRRVDAAAGLAMVSPAMTPSLSGDSLTFTSVGSTLMVNGATVVKPDTFASNGVLHEIDTVLVPPGTTITSTSTTTTTSDTTAAPSTTVTPNTLTTVSPNGTTTTTTPNGTTTVEPSGNTTVSPAVPGGTTVTPNANGSTTVTPTPSP